MKRGDLKRPRDWSRPIDTGWWLAIREMRNERRSDAVADWPILNALLNTASGASWVSFITAAGLESVIHCHAARFQLPDGTDEAGKRLNRC